MKELTEYTNSIQAELEKRQEEERRRQFNGLATDLHHLISTSNIPGVYNSPYIPEEAKPQVFNADIETHLKAAFKRKIKSDAYLQNTFNHVSQGKVDLETFKKKKLNRIK